MKTNILIALEAAKRIGFVVLMCVIATIFSELPSSWNGPVAFFMFGLLGSALLMAATIPLGHTELGADLRGVIGLLICIQAIYLLGLAWAPPALFNWMAKHYKAIDFGIWAMLLARQLWFVRRGMRFLSWPSFDLIRLIFNETSDHAALTLYEKISGYGSMVASFIVGFLLCGHVSYFAAVAAIAPALFLMVSARNAQFDACD